MNAIIENVRTFVGRHRIPIKPLTILTGENSSGKSTFLSCLSVVTSLGGYPLEPKFNNPPYNLGGFDNIAALRGAAQNRAKSFSLGISRDLEKGVTVTALGKYINRRGRIKLSEFEFNSPKGNAYLNLSEDALVYLGKIELEGEERLIEFKFRTDLKTPFAQFGFLQEIIFQVISEKVSPDSFKKIVGLMETPVSMDTLSIAPIRTKPERIYDPSSEHATPEGTHIPFLLERVLSEMSLSAERRQLVTALERFGSESGLFSKVTIKNLGRKGSAPFQVLVNIAGKPINLLDVGYGVSQSMPVVVEGVLASSGKLVLVQQPEVHLHPRAQAALGSFFADIVAHGQKQFVIETHSDYIVDRIRQEVTKDNGLSHDSVLILYFERAGLETTVHPLRLDEAGNILDAPATYRDFFLREELSLLTRASQDGD